MDDAATATLPDDPQALKALCVAIMRERDESLSQRDQVLAERDHLVAVRQQLADRCDALRAHNAWLRRQLYGPRADRLETPADIGQMCFEFAHGLESMPIDPECIPPEDRETDPSDARRVRAKRKKSGRMDISKLHHLPKTECRHELSEAERVCPCCGKTREQIGAEESWLIDRIPAQYMRYHHIRETYACRACDAAGDGGQVVTAPKPDDVSHVAKGMAGPGLIAWIVTSKYSDYLPVYRIENILGRSGLDIARSTMHLWCADVAEILSPVYLWMCDRVRLAHVIATDDTTMPMQAKGRCVKARMWVYAGDAEQPYNVFDFTLSRNRDGPKNFLGGRPIPSGQTLLADGYSGYNEVVADESLVRAGCWSHARRKFVEAQKSEPVIAHIVIEMIRALNAVERRIANADVQVRAEARTTQSRAIVGEIHKRLLAWQSMLLPKSAMAAAVAYTLNQWKPLTVFLDDQAVPIDNNFAEREMKRQAINRKNSLFVASPAGGRVAAILSSITSTCRRHDVNPEQYLTQLLVNRDAIAAETLDDWMPDRWNARQAADPKP